MPRNPTKAEAAQAVLALVVVAFVIWLCGPAVGAITDTINEQAEIERCRERGLRAYENTRTGEIVCR